MPRRHLRGQQVQLLLILNHSTRWGWVVSIKPPCTLALGKEPPVPILSICTAECILVSSIECFNTLNIQKWNKLSVLRNLVLLITTRPQMFKNYKLINISYVFKTGVTLKHQPDSSVSAVTGYGLDDRVIKVPSPAEAKGFFSSSLCVQTGSAVLHNGYRGVLSRG
jgi:hypothetical protein